MVENKRTAIQFLHRSICECIELEMRDYETNGTEAVSASLKLIDVLGDLEDFMPELADAGVKVARDDFDSCPPDVKMKIAGMGVTVVDGGA